MCECICEHVYEHVRIICVGVSVCGHVYGYVCRGCVWAYVWACVLM